MTIAEKRKVLNDLRKNCLKNNKKYNKLYQKFKKYNNIVSFSASLLNASSITLILSTPAIPVLFIPSAVCSSLQFIISRVYEKLNIQDKTLIYLNTSNQYYALMNEIVIVLNKNHLTNEQYGEYIEVITSKIDLIRDTQI